MKKTKNKKRSGSSLMRKSILNAKNKQNKKRINLISTILAIIVVAIILIYAKNNPKIPEIKVDMKQSDAASDFTENVTISGAVYGLGGRAIIECGSYSKTEDDKGNFSFQVPKGTTCSLGARDPLNRYFLQMPVEKSEKKQIINIQGDLTGVVFEVGRKVVLSVGNYNPATYKLDPVGGVEITFSGNMQSISGIGEYKAKSVSAFSQYNGQNYNLEAVIPSTQNLKICAPDPYYFIPSYVDPPKSLCKNITYDLKAMDPNYITGFGKEVGGGVTPVTCTSFTYSAWGTCQPNNTQTRTVTSSSPSGCTGGNPILTQSCTNPTDKTSSHVINFYKTLMGRTPSSGEVDYWKNEFNRVVALGISNGDASLSLAKMFTQSDEYKNKNKSDSDYAGDLYKIFLGRTGSSGEVNYWANQAKTEGREWVLFKIGDSPEAQNYMVKNFGSNSTTPEKSLVSDLYRGILGRYPDSAGFNGWVEYIRSQCGTAQKIKDASNLMAQGFVQSQEYIGRKRANDQYVEDIYEGFLRRGAEAGGRSYWTNMLSTNSLTKLDMLTSFVGSPEFQGRIQNIISKGCK